MIRIARMWPLALPVAIIFGCADYETYEGDKPDSVQLSTAAATDTSVSLRWTRAETGDFQRYEIWYDTDDNVDTLAQFGDSLIFQEDTFTNIDGLEPSTKYYFRAFVRTHRGEVSQSNTVDTTTLDDLQSLRITIANPDTGRITYNSIYLEWESSWSQDRRPFGIFADTTEQVDSVWDTLVTGGMLRVKDRTSKEITGLEPDTDYWFRVFVLDSTGPIAGSEPLKVTTRSDVPVRPVLTVHDTSIGISTVGLSWTAADEMLFEKYVLYCDTTMPSDTTQMYTDSANSWTRREDTTITLDGLLWGRKYYAAVWVGAVTDSFAVSTIDSFVTDSGIPVAPILSIPPDSMHDGKVMLVWDVNTDSFFQEYRVYVDSQAFDESVYRDTSVAFDTIRQRDSTALLLDGISGTRPWWAMVATVSQTGRITAGEVKEFIPEEAMPDPVSLKTVPEHLTDTSGQLTWTDSESSILKRYLLFTSDTRTIAPERASYEDVGVRTSHTVSFSADSIVWYSVAVEDSLGNRTLSEPVPSLGAVLKVEKEDNQLHVFLSKWIEGAEGYGLYRSTEAITEPLPRLQRSYTEDGRALNMYETPSSAGTFYYRVFVFLNDGTYWPSNQAVVTWQ